MDVDKCTVIMVWMVAAILCLIGFLLSGWKVFVSFLLFVSAHEMLKEFSQERSSRNMIERLKNRFCKDEPKT